MSLSQQIEVHNDYLNVVISGDFSLTELIALAKEMYAAIIQHNITKALIDLRLMTGTPSMLERFAYARFIAEEGLAQRGPGHSVLRLAYVGHEAMVDPDSFGEIVARNRGAFVKGTADEQAARAWLGIDKEPDESHRA